MDTPLYVTASVLVAALFAVVALPLVINRSAPGLTGPFAGLVLAVWLVTTALLASNGAYQPAAYGAVPPLGIALVLALAGIALAVGAVPQLRAILSDPAAQPGLLGLQVWRIVGLAFLVLFALGQLPGVFAIPAGIGDSTIGVTAPFVARNLHRRNLVMAWNLFGLADLVLAGLLWVMTSPGPLRVFATTPTSELLTAFPMAIVLTFLVPLSIALHVVSLRSLQLAKARRPGAPALASS